MTQIQGLPGCLSFHLSPFSLAGIVAGHRGRTPLQGFLKEMIFIIDYQIKITFESPLPLLDPYLTDSDPASEQSWNVLDKLDKLLAPPCSC